MSKRFDKVKDDIKRQVVVKAVSASNNSIILVRLKQWFSVEQINMIAESIEGVAAKYKERGISFMIGDKLDLEVVHEKQMNNAGWFKRE